MVTETNVTSPTAALAEWVSSVPDGAIPEDVREAARWLILDHLACSIGGTALTPASIMLRLFDDQGGNDQATVFATGKRTSVVNAVYLNSALSNLLDFDDTHTVLAHPGGTAISPAINVGELQNSSGRDVVTAVTLGFEAMLRLIRAGKPSPERYRQVAGLSVWQTMGSIAAAGRLLKLTPEQFQYAFGLGLMNAPVPNMRKLGLQPEERPFSWTKNNYGWASRGGVLGAMLAGRGFLGNRVILDGERGFWKMAGSDRWDRDLLTDGMDDEWLLPDTGFKPYACCRWTHTALDCVRDFREQNPDVTINDIRDITLHGFFEVSDNLSQADPTDIIDAQFAVRHVMALEFLDRSSRFGLSEGDLDDRAVVELRHRIQVHEDQALTNAYLHDGKMPVTLTVTTADGREITVRNDDPWGNPGRPFEQSDIIAKYRALTEPIIGTAASQRLLDGVLDLDNVRAIGSILPTDTDRTN